MIKAVLLDVGGTLIEPFPSVGHVYAAVADRYGVTQNPEYLNEKFKAAWTEIKKQSHLVNADWWQLVVWRVFDKAMFKEPDLFFGNLYKAFASKDTWRVFPDAKEMLEKLRDKKIQLAIASNWDERLPALLADLNLEHYFDHQFISSQMGVAKPDLKFFQTILRKMDVDPLEIIHVGDDPVEDIKGAENAGIRAYLIDRQKKPINSRMLKDLTEVLLRV